MYKVITSKPFEKRMAKLPVQWQERIRRKIREIADDPYETNNNLTKLQGREGYRLRIGDWRIIYDLYDDRLERVPN